VMEDLTEDGGVKSMVDDQHAKRLRKQGQQVEWICSTGMIGYNQLWAKRKMRFPKNIHIQQEFCIDADELTSELID
jgi:hypothetical protein